MAQMLFICIVYASVLNCVAMTISTSSPVGPGTTVSQTSSVTHPKISAAHRNTQKKTSSMDSSLLKYLRKFKYLDPSACPSCDQDSSIISEALSTLQQWAHINNTGILDSDTVEVMSKRRCGVPDEPKQFSVSSIKSKRHKRSFFWHIYHGSRWYKNDLTYIINMPHKFPNKRAVEKIISAALHAWESVTRLTFTQKRYGNADIEVNFLTGRHGDGSPFDGNGGILAHAFFPYDNSPGLSGDAHFDADEDWGSEMDLNTTADLYCVAVHEFGHSLGLMHSRWPISIMWPWMKGDCTLSKFDIAVIQKIYGSASERKWKKRLRLTAHPPQTTHPFIKPNLPTTTTTIAIASTPFPSTTSSSSTSPITVLSSTTSIPSMASSPITVLSTPLPSGSSSAATSTPLPSTSSSSTPLPSASSSTYKPLPSTSSSSTTVLSSITEPIQTVTRTTPTPSILTTIKTKATATVSSTREDVDTTITITKSPTTGYISMTVTPTEESSTKNPKTFEKLFQASDKMADIVLTQEDSSQTEETAMSASPSTAQISQTSLSTTFHQNTPASTTFHQNTSPSENPLNSSLFQTSTSSDNERKSSGIPISSQSDFIPQKQPDDQSDVSVSSNGLLLQTWPSSPTDSLSEDITSNPNVSPFINTLSTPNSLSSQRQILYPNVLSSKPHTFDSNILASERTSVIQTGSPSQNPPSQTTGLLSKSPVPDQTGSPHLNTLLIPNTSPFNPHSSPSQKPPSQTTRLLYKSSTSENSSPLLNTLFITNNPPSDPPSSPSESLVYTYQSRLKNPHYRNKVDQIHINMFSHLPKIPSSSQRLYLKTSEEPFFPNHHYQQILNSAEEENGFRKERKISKPISSERPNQEYSGPFKINIEQLIQTITSGTKQPKSGDFHQYTPDIQYFSEIQDQEPADELVFGVPSFPKEDSSHLSTQLYKTATVSMTTKPVVSSNDFEWMSTPTSHVTIESEPTIPRKTSPETSVSFQQKGEPGTQTNSYFGMVPSTEILLFDDNTDNPKSQVETLQIVTDQQNGEVFTLKPQMSKTDQNGEETIKNKINKGEPYQDKTSSEQPYILKEWTNGNPYKKIIPIFRRNSYDKFNPTTSKYSKTYTKIQSVALDKTKRISSVVPLFSSEAVPGFGKSLRQQNQEREVFLPPSSVVSTLLKGLALPTRTVPFFDINHSSLSSPTTLFPGGAKVRKNRPYKVFRGKKRLKIFKPRFRQKFIQNLLYSTMRMIPPPGPPLRDAKVEPPTTPSLHKNIDVGTRTLSAPPTSRLVTFKAEPYLIPKAISHGYLSSNTSPTTQKWIGDTQRNLPQLSDSQDQHSAKNHLRESLQILSPVQQTTPLLLSIQNPLGPQAISKDQGYNDGSSNLQASSLLPLRLKLPVSDQGNVPTTSETLFPKIVTPYQHQDQQMIPLSIHREKPKSNPERTGPSSRIQKRSLDESTSNAETTASENWMSKYSLTLATLPSLVLQTTLYGHQLLKIPLRGDNPIEGSPGKYIHYSETDGITTATMPTDSKRSKTMQPSCSGSVQIDGATIDGIGTINIFNGSNVMRFPFGAKESGRKRRRVFIPISRIFPNGPQNITAAASIILGKKQKWERTYLFQGHLVWRYRRCRRRYCLDRGYPTNISQEFNVSTSIEVTAAYANNRRRTLFLFNGTSFYQSVRCQRWTRKNGCNSTETEMRPGLLSSLRGIDAMFTHQGRFYVVHGGSYFTAMLRSIRNNVFQHGSINESWYGCPQNNQTLKT